MLVCFALLAVFAAAIAAPGLAAPQVIRVTSFGASPDSGGDATVPFQRAIAAAKAAGGPVTLEVPPGRYDFFSPHATRRRCFFSNATEPDSDGTRTIAIDLRGLKDLTVEGPGARLVMRGEMTMLAAERCERLTLRGLDFDFARPSVSEIAAVEKGDGYWIGQVQADSAYRLVGNRILWVGEDWSGYHNLVQHVDPAAGTLWRGDDPTAGATSIRDLGGRRLRFDVPPGSLAQVVVGRVYQFRDRRRSETGMWFNRSRGVTLRDVAIHSMSGFGVLFQFVDGVDLEGVAVAPSKGRTCAAAADILHFSGCRGRIRVHGCVLTAANDDAINVHGTQLRIVARPGDRKLRVRFMHEQTWGFAAFAVGDEVELVNKDTLLAYANAKVTEVEMTSDPREQILTFDRPIPAKVRLGSDVVENVTWTPSVEIEGCRIGQVPTRGILVTTRRPIRIVGNRFFRTPMPAVLVADDAKSWFESGPVHDLLVEGNVFEGCAGNTIQILPEITTYAGPVHRKIRIEKNAFDLCGSPAVSAKATAGLSVVGNRFRVSGATPPKEADLVQTTDVTDLRVSGNVVVPVP